MAGDRTGVTARIRALAAALSPAAPEADLEDDPQAQARMAGEAAAAEAVRRVREEACIMVHQKPLTVLGVSFLAGVLLAGMWRRG